MVEESGSLLSGSDQLLSDYSITPAAGGATPSGGATPLPSVLGARTPARQDTLIQVCNVDIIVIPLYPVKF